jgi:hypothetical protein
LKSFIRIARILWLTTVILATQEAEIRKIVVRSQPGANRETLSQKYPSQKGLVELLNVKALNSSPSTTKKSFISI